MQGKADVANGGGQPTAPPVALMAAAGAATGCAKGHHGESRGAEGRSGTHRAANVVGILVVGGFWLVIGAAIAWGNTGGRMFIPRWWWAIVLAFVGAALALAIPAVVDWLRQQPSIHRAGLFIFGVVPLLLGLVGSVTVLPQRYQVTALRLIVLITVCLLPGAMWYLFIATRKASLLYDFLTNLDRLGLLDPSLPGSSNGSVADDPARDRRIPSYLEKFEAVYGALPPKVREDVLQNKFTRYPASERTAPARLSTTTVPVMLSTILIALGWLITLPPMQALPAGADANRWMHALEPTETPVTMAFIGAYFFSLQMLFRRYVRRDLRGSAYVAVSMRIVLAMIGVWVVMVASDQLGLASRTQLLVVGFAIGVFPRVVWQVVQAVFKKSTSFALQSLVSDLPVSDLDGLTVWHEARLEEEDIENIPNMATADLVELLVNTRFPADRIIDWIDQAILFTQLGAQGKKAEEDGPASKSARDRLALHGIRNATSLLAASAASAERRDSSAFRKILVQDGVDLLPFLEATLRTNSNLELIQRWRARSPVRAAAQPPPRADGGAAPGPAAAAVGGAAGRMTA